MQSDSVASPSGAAPLYDIVVAHVGSAGPRIAGVVASGLNLPVEAVISTIYRTPAVLAAGLGAPVADRLVAERRDLGLAVFAAPAGTPLNRGPLLDVAAEIVDPAQADAAAAVLADFIGSTPAAALEMMLAPPGMILGQASAATVAALAARLPEGAVSLATVDPATTRYTLFAAKLPKSERTAIAALVPEGFLRFDLHLIHADGDPEALEGLAGIPAADVPHIIPLLPVTVEERLSQEQAETRMAEYAAAGFTVTAHLSTFATSTLEIGAVSPAALTLVGAGSGVALPIRLPPLAAPRARVLRARLEARAPTSGKRRHDHADARVPPPRPPSRHRRGRQGPRARAPPPRGAGALSRGDAHGRGRPRAAGVRAPLSLLHARQPGASRRARQCGGDRHSGGGGHARGRRQSLPPSRPRRPARTARRDPPQAGRHRRGAGDVIAAVGRGVAEAQAALDENRPAPNLIGLSGSEAAAKLELLGLSAAFVGADGAALTDTVATTAKVTGQSPPAMGLVSLGKACGLL